MGGGADLPDGGGLGSKAWNFLLRTYFTLSKYNLESSLGANGMPGAPFEKGLNNLAYHEEIITRTKSAIDLFGIWVPECHRVHRI